MTWVDILVAILKVIIYLATFLFIVWLLTRFLFRQFTKNFIFWLKYTIFRRHIPDDTALWCASATERGLDYFDVKQYLLIKDVSPNKINETLYIFKKIQKQLGKEGYQFKKKEKFDANELPEV